MATGGQIAARFPAPIRHSPVATRPSSGRLNRPRSIVKEQLAQPLAEIAPIIFAHGLVADAGGDLADARFKRGAALGRREAAGFGLTCPQHVGERPRRREHRLDSLAPARAPEDMWVLPLGETRKSAAVDGASERYRQ